MVLKFIRRISGLDGRFPVGKSNIQTIGEPRILPRSEHTISRANISDAALKVLYRLKDAGYQGYLVGGCVRDLMLGREPKDFDVATNATPEQVRELFRNSRLIGRRFRLAHVRYGREIIEVATFRAQHEGKPSGEKVSKEGRILRDNVYGDIEDDVIRRDFTINAMYYTIEDFSVVDYVNGLEDIEKGQMRLLGDPEQRYREDPVRMLRAVRFAAKLGFRIEKETEQPLFELGHLLKDIPSARLYEEVLKLFLGGCALETFEQLRHYDLFKYLFPLVEESLAEEEQGFPHMMIQRALINTDLRLNSGKTINPGFLIAAFLWDAKEKRQQHHIANDVKEYEALHMAADEVLQGQVRTVAVPRRLTTVSREIWSMQPRLTRLGGKRAYSMLANPRFRAAYDFLLLRAEVDETLQGLAEWWTEFQEAEGDRQGTMVSEAPKFPRKRRIHRTRRRRRVPSEDSE